MEGDYNRRDKDMLMEGEGLEHFNHIERPVYLHMRVKNDSLVLWHEPGLIQKVMSSQLLGICFCVLKHEWHFYSGPFNSSEMDNGPGNNEWTSLWPGD